MKKKFSIFVLLLLISTSSTVYCDDYVWTALGDGSSWDDAGNWTGGTSDYPDSSSDNAYIAGNGFVAVIGADTGTIQCNNVYVSHGNYASGGTLNITTGGTLDLDGALFFGGELVAPCADNGTVNINGGSLTGTEILSYGTGHELNFNGGNIDLTERILMGNDGNVNSVTTINITAGTLNATHMNLGAVANSGTHNLNMSGGTVNLTTNINAPAAAGYANIHFDGGTITMANKIWLNDNATFHSTMDMTGDATMIIGIDWTSYINDWISAGLMTSYAGDGYFQVDYDERVPGKTAVTVRETLVIMGDLNLDNMVDFFDLKMLAQSWLSDNNEVDGKLVNDGTVNLLDFAPLAENWLVGTIPSVVDGDTAWYDCSLLTVDGKGWTDTESFYDRMPAKAEGVVTDKVWGLSHDSAGICVRFKTDATSIEVKWELNSSGLDMGHMPSTGVSGIDIYGKKASDQWFFIGNGRPSAIQNTATFNLTSDQEYMLCLPTYNGVKSVEIGVDKNYTVTKPADYTCKPIVFYGTSITQGGCASRPGTSAVAIVGRSLDMPVINLGFSGAGKLEPEMSDLLAELDPSIYVIDCLWNMGSLTEQEMHTRFDTLIHNVRLMHPDTPILLVEDSNFQNITPTTKGAILRAIYQEQLNDGVTNLHFLSNEMMIGDDGEGTVDRCHLTDLGMMRQAEVFIPAITNILN
jgi:hypothetical protein